MVNKVLFAWIGRTDLHAAQGNLPDGLGPIGQAVSARKFSHVVLISDFLSEEEKYFVDWLKAKTLATILKYHFELSSPTNFDEIYKAVTEVIKKVKKKIDERTFQSTYHLSPGTPAMAAIWIILSKTSHPAELIESSKEKGVKTVSLPFEISADYIPDILRPTGDDMLSLTQGLPAESPAFTIIIHRCKEMKRVIAKARRLAALDVSVLIQGESGTGKELFARAIHANSARQKEPFVPVNCGAIPPDLVEAFFFGHEKGAYTGADKERTGYFELANHGSLFLDEIGELPLNAQVKLLRAIEEGEISKIGGTKTIKIDIKIIAATNRNLIEAVASKSFREDLLHRIAVGVLNLPPIRERHGDINPIIDHILESINKKFDKGYGWQHKKLSAGARNLMHQLSWRGNVRELSNTLTRAAIMVTGTTVETDDIRDALFSVDNSQKDNNKILNRSLGNGFSLTDVIADVARHYLERSNEEAKGNKKKIASLLGFPNYQTASNWMKKYGLK